MLKGKFLTLEGTEGVGKSSNLAFVQDYLNQQGVAVVMTREPGGTPLAETIRELVLAPREERMNALTELLLIFAARKQHIEEVIKPALAQGQWVLSDRFTDATYAYQGYGRELSLDVIAQLENLVQADLRPDLTIVLDLDIHVGLARAKARGKLDRIESEHYEFFQRVREGYKALAQQNPHRYMMVDAEPELPEVQSSIQQGLEKFLAKAKHD